MSHPDRLIVGLGNPGSDYEGTRHNLGFEVVTMLARRYDLALGRLECRSLVAKKNNLILALPQTYMNRSGYAVRCLVEGHELDPRDVLVVYDDVDLPLGKLRLRPEGGPGGHRGMESIVQNLRTEDIARLRLGVAPTDTDLADLDLVEFVLQQFEAEERDVVENLLDRAVDACELWLREGNEATMNRFNG